MSFLLLARRASFALNLPSRLMTTRPSSFGIREISKISSEAEDMGFSMVTFGDSILTVPRPDPLMLLSSVALISRKVLLGTCVMILPLRNPILIAHQTATLDIVSGGRLVLMAGIGGAANASEEIQYRNEAGAFNISYPKRGFVFDEQIQIIRKLWEGNSLTFRGKYFNLQNVTMPIRPVKQNIPIIVSGNPWAKSSSTKESVFKRVGRLGDGWITARASAEQFKEGWSAVRSAALQAGRDPSRFENWMLVGVSIPYNQHPNSDSKEFLNEFFQTEYPDREIARIGPHGTAKEAEKYFESYLEVGLHNFVCRFDSFDQVDMIKSFSKDILPSFS